MTTDDQITRLAEHALADSGIELVEVSVGGSGRERKVELIVDKPGGVTLDDCAKASNLVSEYFDEADPIPGKYRLDVASPGLERPLRTPEEFARAVGSDVRIKVRDREPISGTLVATSDADPATVSVDTGSGSGSEIVQVVIDEIVRARTILDWGPAPKPGKQQPQKKAAAG